MSKKLNVEWRHVVEVIFESSDSAKKFAKDPRVIIDFDISQCDDEDSNININTMNIFPRKIEKKKDYSVSIESNSVILGIDYLFEITTDDNVSEDDFDSWAYNNGGDNCLVLDIESDEDYELEVTSNYLGTKDILGFSHNSL